MLYFFVKKPIDISLSICYYVEDAADENYKSVTKIRNQQKNSVLK